MQILCQSYISIHRPVVVLELAVIFLHRALHLVDLQEQMVLFLFVGPCERDNARAITNKYLIKPQDRKEPHAHAKQGTGSRQQRRGIIQTSHYAPDSLICTPLGSRRVTLTRLVVTLNPFTVSVACCLLLR